MRNVDVAIIGAGSAGLSARSEVAKITENYLVIDDGPLGTTCARVGCMPSKVLIQAANDFHRRHKFSAMGINGGSDLSIDLKTTMEHVRSLRDRFVRGVLGGISSWQDTHLIQKRATFIDQNSLKVGDEIIKAKKIIIATGSKPILPDAWNEYKDYFVDSDFFFELENFPKKMAVLGYGVIGLELGQAIHRLGVEVTFIGRRPVVGGLTDPEIASYTWKKLSEEMDLSSDGIEILGKSKNGLRIKTGEREIEVEKVLFGLGRQPMVKGLGLENLGIEFNSKDVPLYDPETYLVKGTEGVYLTGDATGIFPVLHEASDEGKTAGFNAVRENRTPFKKRTRLSVTFSDPNICLVGKSYKELKDEGIDFVTGEVSFEGQGRSIVMLKECGLMHVYGCKKSGLLLGAELFAPSGEHMAHLLAWAIASKKTVFEILSFPFYHPVLEEGLRAALRGIKYNVDAKEPPLEVPLA